MKAVNLLPPDMRGATKAPSERTVVTDDTSGLGAYAVLGALALAVLALAGVVLTGNAVKDREAQLATAKAQHEQVAGRAAALKPYADFDTLAAERVATVKDLAGRRFDWEQALRDLSRAIPADVTLEDLTGSVSTDTGGGGGSPLRSAIAAPAISLTGCTDGHRGVARLMARLRNVDGVTRVSLSKSEKQKIGMDDTAGATSDAPTGATMAGLRAAPCGTGVKPSFQLVMFFEGDADKASGPGATPAAAGQGAPAAAATTAPATATATPAPGATATQSSTTGQTGAQSAPASTTQGGVSP